MTDSQNFSYHTFQARTTYFEHPTPLRIRQFTSSTYDSLKKRERSKGSRREKKLLGQRLVTENTWPGTTAEFRRFPEHACSEINSSDTTVPFDLEVPFESDTTFQRHYSTGHVQGDQTIRGTTASVPPDPASSLAQIQQQDITPLPRSIAKSPITSTHGPEILGVGLLHAGNWQVSESDSAAAAQEYVEDLNTNQDVPQSTEALLRTCDNVCVERPANLLCDLPHASHRVPGSWPDQVWTCEDEGDLIQLRDTAQVDWKSIQECFPWSKPASVREKYTRSQTNAMRQALDVSTDVGHVDCKPAPRRGPDKHPERKTSTGIGKRNKLIAVENSQTQAPRTRSGKSTSKMVSKPTYARDAVRSSRSGRPIRHHFQNRPDEGYL